MIDLASQTCLVTGASGFLGSFVVERLVERGARVRCLLRKSSSRAFLPNGEIEVAIGDVTDLESLRSAVVDVDVVFHLAGLIKARRPEEYYRVNYLGTVNLLEACREHADRLRRVMVVSSQAAAGPSAPGEPISEESPCRPVTPYGRSKREAEQAVAAFHRHLPLTIVRPPTIYGPRDRETLMLFRLAARGIRPSLAGGGEVSVIHASDLADGILLAAAHPVAIGQTYFMAGDETPSMDELMGAIARTFRSGGIALPISPWMLRAGARAAEVLRDLGGQSLVFDHWKAEEILSRYWACSSARAKAELGFAPRIPLADGLADTARWYRKMGWL